MTTLSLSGLLTLLLLFLLISSSSAAHCNPSDKKALIQIQADLGNPYLLIAWNTPGAGGCCSWPGVDCDPATGRVNSLDISTDGFSARIPASLADLPFLTGITFHKLPNLTGPIPPVIGKLTKLTFLRLDWNSLSGPVPSFLSRLTSLTYLNLAFNQLSGSVPAFLGYLPVLGFIRLDRNRLTGSIPESLARSPSTYLYLSHNNLTGPIPASFAAAGVAFETIDLSRNRLTGDASLLFGFSKPAQSIDISRNLFEFDLTAVEFPENLTWLDLNHNKIYGRIPPPITKLELQFLNVSYNRLCGEIPVGGVLGRFDQYSYFHNRCLCGPPLAACRSGQLSTIFFQRFFR